MALRRKARETGLLRAALLAARQFRRELLYREEILFFADLQGYEIPPLGRANGARSRHIVDPEDLTSADVAALQEYGGAGYVDEARSRLTRDWQLFVGYIDGEPAGGAWVLTSVAECVSKAAPIAATDLAILDCFTFPAKRGQGIYPHLLADIAYQFGGAGFVRAYIASRRYNAASLRGIRKAGFSPVATYLTARLGSKELVLWKRRASPDS